MAFKMPFVHWDLSWAVQKEIMKRECNEQAISAMKQYINQMQIKQQFQYCEKNLPDPSVCYQMVFGDDYFWSWNQTIYDLINFHFRSQLQLNKITYYQCTLYEEGQDHLVPNQEH